MPERTRERWEQVARGFEKCANFPSCIGAITGKHIWLVKVCCMLRNCARPRDGYRYEDTLYLAPMRWATTNAIWSTTATRKGNLVCGFGCRHYGTCWKYFRGQGWNQAWPLIGLCLDGVGSGTHSKIFRGRCLDVGLWHHRCKAKSEYASLWTVKIIRPFIMSPTLGTLSLRPYTKGIHNWVFVLHFMIRITLLTYCIL